MFMYIVEVIAWTLIFFNIFEIIRIIINKFIIKPNEIKKIFNKTKSDSRKIQ